MYVRSLCHGCSASGWVLLGIFLTACSATPSEEQEVSSGANVIKPPQQRTPPPADPSPASTDLQGTACYDAPGVFDKNGDGVKNVLDCVGDQGPTGPQGASGPQGPKGDSCWVGLGDLNGDSVEDIEDCRVSLSEKVEISSAELHDLIQNSHDNILELPKSKTVSLALQNDGSVSGTDYWCARVDVKNVCGDSDGCHVTLKAISIGDADDDHPDQHSFQLIPENFDLFHGPNGPDEVYVEKKHGVYYQALRGGLTYRNAHTAYDGYGVTGDVSGSKRRILWSDSAYVWVENYSDLKCKNFGLSLDSFVHEEPHVFTIGVRQDFLGLLVFRD